MTKFHIFLKDTALMASAGGIGCLTGNPIGLAVIALSPVYGVVKYYTEENLNKTCDELSDLLERYNKATDTNAFIDSLSEKEAKRITHYIQKSQESEERRKSYEQ